MWSFSLPTRLTVGHGSWRLVPAAVARYGRRVLLVTGADSLRQLGVRDELARLLTEAGVAAMPVMVAGEPDTDAVDAAARTAREARCDVVLAVGGGSAMDLAKAAAAMAVNPGETRAYLEGLGAPPAALVVAPLPVLCVPTTAGTGSEVSRNAVIGVDGRLKRSMRADSMAPREAFIDPSLSAAAPLSVRAACGFDALTHLVEAFCSKNASPFTDTLAREGIERGARALRRLADEPRSAGIADDLAWAALLGGICLAHAGLGAAHGLVAALGGLHPRARHGAALACLLPATLLANAAALSARAPDAPARKRLAEIAALIVGPGATVPLAARALTDLRRRFGLPGLAAYGVADLEPIIANPSGSIRTNPIELTTGELRALLASALAD